jgi:hypothetical protein
MTATCPHGHPSADADFCSVCGAEMLNAPAPPAPDCGVCPDCATPRESPRQVYCEVCGHNFRTNDPGQVPQVPVPVPTAASVRWDVVVEVDPNLHGKPDLAAPAGHPVQTFTLFGPENVVGRGGPDVRVQVPVRHDHGISRRHALFLSRPDGSLAVRDLASANGTRLNGDDILPGVDTPVCDGDVIAVGAWTRITVRAARETTP